MESQVAVAMRRSKDHASRKRLEKALRPYGVALFSTDPDGTCVCEWMVDEWGSAPPPR